MADINIQMTQRNAANTAWDNLYPETGYVRSPAYGPATGVVNAYTFSAMPATALIDGMSVYLDNVIAANTGAATFNWSGLGAKAIVDGKGNALSAGKMPLNCIIGLRYNASITSFQLLGEGGEVYPHSSQTYATPGSYTFTVPTNVTQITFIEVGGGGGGGHHGYDDGFYDGGGGGGGGGYVATITVAPGDTLSIVVGAGGAGLSGSGADYRTAPSGENSSVSSYIAYGGLGGGYNAIGVGGAGGGFGGNGNPGKLGPSYTGGPGGTGNNGGTGGAGTGSSSTGGSGGSGKVTIFW